MFTSSAVGSVGSTSTASAVVAGAAAVSDGVTGSSVAGSVCSAGLCCASDAFIRTRDGARRAGCGSVELRSARSSEVDTGTEARRTQASEKAINWTVLLHRAPRSRSRAILKSQGGFLPSWVPGDTHFVPVASTGDCSRRKLAFVSCGLFEFEFGCANSIAKTCSKDGSMRDAARTQSQLKVGNV